METNELLQQILTKVSSIDQHLGEINKELSAIKGAINSTTNIDNYEINNEIQNSISRLNIKTALLNGRMFEQEAEIEMLKEK